MNPTILFRDDGSLDARAEIDAIKKIGFNIEFSRTKCKDSLVIPRYSCLPFYRELEEDLKYNGCTLVNSYREHQYIANFDWYEDLKEYTPETWFEPSKIPDEGQFIVKGRINSRKNMWATKMFAKDRNAAISIYCDLVNDPMLTEQGIIIRRYVPLINYGFGINGQPFVNEWRFFYWKTDRLLQQFYWSISDESKEKALLERGGTVLADKVAEIVSKKSTFFVLDIAQDINGKWWLIEINDGGMSGVPYSELSRDLYSSLKFSLTLEGYYN